MKFFEVQCPNRISVIAAHNENDAVSKVFSDDPGTEYQEDVWVREEHSENHKIEVSCIGFPEYKTLRELYEELDNKELPVQICELAW